jgi:hypothetical protein
MKNQAPAWIIWTIVLIINGFNTKAANISIRAYDASRVLFAESKTNALSSTGEISLKIEREYLEGDYLVIEGARKLFVQLDISIQGCYVYTPNGSFTFRIPIQENGKNYRMESFSGSKHEIKVRICTKEEWSDYRNLALNSFDIRGETNYYPHATSNSECRNESFYAARNVIDGHKSNTKHGKWPFQAWGPDIRDDLWLKIDFGKSVEVDKLVIVNRAQYSDLHDSYWKEAIVQFSDGSSEKIKMMETALPQALMISKHNTSWVKFTDLNGNENKWCSWVEIEVWGRDQDLDLVRN